IDPSIRATAAQVAPSTGSGHEDGQAKVTATGGTGQYIIEWDNGEATLTPTKLSSGVHSVTITDKAGCSTITNVTINEKLTSLSVKLITLNENKCADGYSGQLKVELTGGKAPFQYNWNTGS